MTCNFLQKISDLIPDLYLTDLSEFVLCPKFVAVSISLPESDGGGNVC